MSDKEIQLTEKDVLEKDFKIAMRGYNQDEVDRFLDIIIEDYLLYSKKVEMLKTENERLKKLVNQPRSKPPQPPIQQVNYDVLKRLSNLEKEVFGKKLTDS